MLRTIRCDLPAAEPLYVCGRRYGGACCCGGGGSGSGGGSGGGGGGAGGGGGNMTWPIVIVNYA